ncbi:coiled-coil domain-containing protein 180-like [Gigantopelta aegis]|uniref:coiled-coil domain-containing protein 180-like n=1 Tax=Gigantopelta aegis TaxID=1735272 RepID=UPI001B88D5D1|nr:coiled-coil domain-containing protein 180-like [Gigantopelta aegis]
MSTDFQMPDTRAVRVVPNGKIYRQMFDAQVQLHRSLTGFYQKQKKHVPREETSSSLIGAPLVHLKSDDVSHGLLSERQKTWAEAFPNDPLVENPVLIKRHEDFWRAQLKEGDFSIASKEVQGLPDVVVPAKTGSDIIERIYTVRKERHEATVEDMHQELNVISSELEPKIIEVSDNVLLCLEEDNKEIDKILASIEQDEDLLKLSQEGMSKLWAEVKAHSPVRLGWITDLDTLLRGIENKRMEMIQNVFYTYSQKFDKIAFLMPPDLQRFLDKEAQQINQTMLSNQRAYADLYVRLMSADVEREKSQHMVWRKRLEDWKHGKSDMFVVKFREFMKSDDVENPPGVQQVLQFMNAEQQMLNSKRVDLVESLREIKPPLSTKTAIYKWNQQMLEVTSELDAVNQMHMSKLHEEYENVCKDCLDHLESIKEELISAGLCDEKKAQELVNTEMLPLVGERQALFEKSLEDMEKNVELHHSLITEKIAAMFKFAQGAAHVWDVHEIGLAKQERILQEKLEHSRHEHDNFNQEREANLDIVMDRMRQDANEVDLKENLKIALDMLDKIRMSYEVFHKKQTEIVKSYPVMARFELEDYEHTVCKFFKVDRHKLPEKTTESGTELDKTDSNISDADQEDAKEKEEPETAATEEDATESSEKEDASKEEVADGTQKEPTKEDVPEVDARSEDVTKDEAVVKQGVDESLDSDLSIEDTEFFTEKYQSDKKPSSPLPSAVNEILLTEKGTTFYVLSEAGLEVIPVDSLFPAVGQEEMPPYIVSVDLSTEFLLSVKDRMRLNFLNHLEEWKEEAMERAHSVVVAKCEELNSELDLRLHLHQPRPRRAEFDVHNVRAAELVMHSERVVRHCKGINQALFELKDEFKKMSDEHDKLTKKFKEDIEALETIFINATKSSRLVALQNQLSQELNKFMSVIRISLRQFRQHLDDTLQMLRESNARFIKSFKVFSDGGNFCPVEIEDYRKRLEKMSNKIDENEGSIMSDLEGMESKRLDQATKVAMEFEDRFKNHMFDLIFMEKIARWFTNTQVKIKSEVADSNTQAQKLAQYLVDLERRIDACEKPNLDKEQITSTQLNESLKSLMEAFHARSLYLNCGVKTKTVLTSDSSNTLNPASARVGFAQEVPPMKSGKMMSEDPSVGLIKSIIKTNKSKQRFGQDGDLDGDTQPSVTPGSSNLPALSASSNKSPKSGRRGTLSVIYSETPSNKRISSGHFRNRIFKIDKKFYVFGEKPEEQEDTHLIGIVRKILREANDGLLSHAELYYRQKGNRSVTRPQSLPENFDGCADVAVQKLLSYMKQTTDYHNQCLQEFRNQLIDLEKMISHVPALVIHEIVSEEIDNANSAQSQLESLFTQTLSGLKMRQQEHKNLLRPPLGHPHQQEALNRLCEKEAVRHTDFLEAVEQEMKSRQECAVRNAKEFLGRLVNMSESQLLLYDNLLVVDDIDKGKVEVKRFSTSELIRRQNAGEPLFEEEDTHIIKRGKGNWKGIPNNEFVVDPKPSKTVLTPSVTTTSTTLGHRSTINARDSAYMEYKANFEQTLASIVKEKERLELAEQRWTDSWNISVKKVKELY